MKKETLIKRMTEVAKTFTSDYKMGDLNTLNVRYNGEQLTAVHDTRQYYTGRGAKYNSSIRHGNITMTMTVHQVNAAYLALILKKRKEVETARKRKALEVKCKDMLFIMSLVADQVDIIADKPAPAGDNRYWINGYHGCGVYRLAIKAGRIVATIKGGYHDSKPYSAIPTDMWVEAINTYLQDRLGEYTMVKADGSGCSFFLRDGADALLSIDTIAINTKEYNVPAPNGDGSNGYTHRNIEIV